eukprot:UN12246
MDCETNLQVCQNRIVMPYRYNREIKITDWKIDCKILSVDEKKRLPTSKG